MMDSDNPAGRLYDFLASVRGHSPHVSVRNAVCGALLLETSTPTAALARTLAVVLEWPEEAFHRVQELTDVNKDRLVRWKTNVDAAMEQLPNFDSQVQNVTARYNDRDLADLEHCADALHLKAPEPTIEPDRLRALDELISQAIQAVVEDGQLGTAARYWLVERLNEVQRAVQNFRISGYDGVDAAMDRLVGGTLLRTDTQTQTAMSWVGRVLRNFKMAVSGVGELGTAAQSVFGALESGSDFLSGS